MQLPLRSSSYVTCLSICHFVLQAFISVGLDCNSTSSETLKDPITIQKRLDLAKEDK